MPAFSPEEVEVLFIKHFNSGQIDEMLTLYEDDVTTVVEPGKVLHGKDAVRKNLERYVHMKPQITVEPQKVVKTSDIAILYSKWTLRGQDEKGEFVELDGLSQDVMRKQADGTWLCVIDNAFGIL